MIVDVEGDHAVAYSDYLFVRIVEGTVTPLFTGRYHDEFVRAEGGSLIRSRVVSPLT